MSKTSLIYSELLSNIRQISVIAALDTPRNASTKVELSVAGHQFILSHNGKTTTLDLPGQVALNAQLQKPMIGSRELSWRLPLAAQPSRASEDAQSNEAPWSAASLTEDVGLSCRGCGASLIERGTIKNWKDLPSENWAEMMDFWHCHKPDVPHAHGSSDQPAVPDKGYGPNSRFAATPGVGFVDLTTLLLFDTDCVGIQSSPLPLPPASDKSTTSPPTYQPLTCASCTRYLGYHDPQSEGTRFYKWRLSLSTSGSSSSPPSAATPPLPPSKPSLATILSAHLLSIVQSQCVSRILILPHPNSQSQSRSNPSTLPEVPAVTSDDEGKALSLWIFAPTLRFSSSSSSLSTSSTTTIKQPHKPTLATKIFHQSLSLSLSSASALLEKGNIEELYLPSEAISELGDVLRKSGELLPPSARRFQVWDVGLLERYEE